MAAEAFRRSAVDIRLELATAEDRASQDAQTADIAQALAAEQLGDLERRIHGLEAAISAATVRLGERAEELAALHRERDALESARATAISRVSDLEATSVGVSSAGQRGGVWWSGGSESVVSRRPSRITPA